MSSGNGLLEKKWNVVQEQLIALCALKRLPKGNEDFAALLRDDVQLKRFLGYSEKMNAICYYILGIIDCEERDRLIQWPLINIKTRTKFRKGVAALVKGFQEKYPWANIMKIPESYFMNLQGYQTKAIDFILRLTNLAIHIALNDPKILMMHSGDKVSASEIEIMTEVISEAKEKEEEIMKNHVVPLDEIEYVKDDISYKCISLIQLNDDLQQQLNSLVKYAHKENLIPAQQKIDAEALGKIRSEMVSELNDVNEELARYCNESKVLLSKIKELKNPKTLCLKDFGCNDLHPDLVKATSRVCGDLCHLFQYVAAKSCTKDEEDSFFEQLKLVNKALAELNKEMSFFLNQRGVIVLL